MLKSQNICLAFRFTNCPLHADKRWRQCYAVFIQMKGMMQRVKLKDTTFILGDKPMRKLMWCDCVPKAKRNKPAKLNGILVSEVQVYHEL